MMPPKKILKILIYPFLITSVSILLYSCIPSITSNIENRNVTYSAAINTPLTYSTTQAPTSTLGKLPRTPPPAPSGIPPTWTPLPTFSSDQANEFALNLFTNNPCKLSCWWGITPGKTSWLNAWQFLGRFASNQYPWETLLQESHNLPGYMLFQIKLNFPKIPNEQYYMITSGPLLIINIKSFKVDYIDVYTGNVKAYILSSILDDYGKPEQIFVMGGETPIASGVELFLYYPDYGFISIHYTEVEHSVWTKPSFTTCFENVTTSLELWPKEQAMEFYSRLQISRIYSLTKRTIRPLEEVSNFNIDEFYNAFTTSHQPPCILFETSKLLETH